MLKWRILLAAVAALAVFGAGCSDGAETTTTTAAVIDSADDVIFGDGSLPETIPAGFPLPVGSAVGSTMVVVKTGFTEVVIRVSAEMALTTEFFNQALIQNGFIVDSSAADDTNWLIEFSDETAKGTITLSEPIEGVSQAIVRYNTP